MIRKILQITLVFLFMNSAHAGASWQSGIIFDHTSIAGGLLIRFDHAVTQLPDNCAGATSTWIIIPETNKAMMAVMLIALATNNRSMTVHTKGIGLNGYCEVNQIDPAG